MDEYISREAAVRYLREYSEKELNKKGSFGLITSSVLDKAERALSEMPSADVKPVRRGRWIRNGLMLNRQKCSECGFCDDALQADNFCPNCGAEMVED